MKLLFTAHSYPPDVSGVAAVVSAVAERLAARGHEVHVASGTMPGLPAREIRNGVTVHRFSVSGNTVGGIKGDTSSFRALAGSPEWHVVITNCAQTWVTDALLPEIDNIPAARAYMGHGLSALRNPDYQAYYRWFAERLTAFDRVFALSRGVEEVEFCRERGLPSPVIVPNGVSVEEWSKPRLNIRAEWGIGSGPWMVSVSNHSPQKGHPRLIEAADALRAAFPELKTTLIGNSYPAAKWGSGRFGVRGGCWYRCSIAAALRSYFELRPRVPRPKVVSAVQEADVLVMGSRWEASPIAILEAMAAGTPWVSFDVGCVAEHPGGIVVRSVGEMTEALTTLFRDPMLRTTLGRQGHERIRAAHSWDAVVCRYEEEFQKAADSNRRRLTYA